MRGTGSGVAWIQNFNARTPQESFARGLREDAERLNRLEVNRAPIDEIAYATEHHLDALTRRPLRFDDRPYLRGIYADGALAQVIKKSVQSCLTERFLVHALIRAGEQGYSVLYVLPSQMARSTFVPNRVDRLFSIAPHYRELARNAIGHAESVALKHFGVGTIKFVGSNSQDEFVEFPADSLIVDEYDRCNLENLLLAPDRLTASLLKEDIRFSTPSIEGYGIDRAYGESDAKRWMVRCGRCGLAQAIDWFQNVVREVESGQFALRDRHWDPEGSADASANCLACEAPIDRLGPGEWVAEYPNRDVSGYHVSKMIAPVAKAGERQIATLWAKFQKGQSDLSVYQVFMNSDLGLAWTAPGAKLTEALLAACADEAHHLLPQAVGCAMGVDVGKVFHVEITDNLTQCGPRVVWAGTVQDDEELSRLMRAYDVRCCVVDAAPETHLVKKFQARHPGRVFLARYDANRIGEPLINTDDGIVSYDRTQSLDASHAELLERGVILPAEFRTIDGGEFVRQMCAPARVFEESRGRYVWIEGSEPDHYRHAHNYNWIARDLRHRGFGGRRWGAMVVG